MRGFARRGLPRTPTVDQTNPDLQLLFGSLYYHGGLGADPPSPRGGEMWLRTDLESPELRALVGTDVVTLLAVGAAVDANTLQGENGAFYQDRANHTGDQLAATISNFAVAALAATATAYEASGTVMAHELAPDPHPQYLTPAEGGAAYDASGAAAAAQVAAIASALASLATHEADSTAVHGITNTALLVLTGDSRLSDARAPTAHAINTAGGFHTGTLDKGQQHPLTPYLDGAAGQSWTNRQVFAGGLEVTGGTGSTGRMWRDTTNGLAFRGVAGSTNCLVYLNDANQVVLSIANGAQAAAFPGNLSTGGTFQSTGVATFTTSADFGGRVNANGGVAIGGGSGGLGRLWSDASFGLALRGLAGATDCFRLYNNANTTVLSVPVGTTTVGFPGQISSTVATGTSPFVIASTTLVANLNAGLLGGQNSAYHLSRANHTGTQGWATVDKTISSLADLATRSAADLSSGTLADARLSSNIPRLGAGFNDFVGTVQVADLTVTGSFEAAGGLYDGTVSFNGGANLDGAVAGLSTMTLGLFGVTPAVRAAVRTISNDSSNRILNVSTVTLTQLANFVATMARDMIGYGLYA